MRRWMLAGLGAMLAGALMAGCGEDKDGGCKERDLAARFGALQARIQDSANADDLDPRTKAALKALGYSR